MFNAIAVLFFCIYYKRKKCYTQKKSREGNNMGLRKITIGVDWDDVLCDLNINSVEPLP